MTSYYEKLKDPRWQKKRLEILSRANFSCETCGDKKSTLHVHHGYYASGMNPWDYENTSLYCVCETCHESIGALMHDIHLEIARTHPNRLDELFGIIVNFLQENPDADMYRYKRYKPESD